MLFSISPGSPVPEAAVLLIPATSARVHEKIVPAVPLVGMYENIELLQIAVGLIVLVRIGLGLTVTTISYGIGFVQPPADKV